MGCLLLAAEENGPLYDGQNCHGEGAGQWKGAAERVPEISKDYKTAEISLVEIELKAK